MKKIQQYFLIRWHEDSESANGSFILRAAAHEEMWDSDCRRPMIALEVLGQVEAEGFITLEILPTAAKLLEE